MVEFNLNYVNSLVSKMKLWHWRLLQIKLYTLFSTPNHEHPTIQTWKSQMVHKSKVWFEISKNYEINL